MNALPADPAFQMVTEDEARAMRLAVTVALEQGLATDGLDADRPTNRSMVSLGRKLGCEIPSGAPKMSSGQESR